MKFETETNYCSFLLENHTQKEKARMRGPSA